MERPHPTTTETAHDEGTRSVANPRRVRVDADGRPIRTSAERLGS